jgi:hypothetical protein
LYLTDILKFLNCNFIYKNFEDDIPSLTTHFIHAADIGMSRGMLQTDAACPRRNICVLNSLHGAQTVFRLLGWQYSPCLVRNPKIHCCVLKSPPFFGIMSHTGGSRWRSWLRHCATSRKVAGSIPDGVTGIFH